MPFSFLLPSPATHHASEFPQRLYLKGEHIAIVPNRLIVNRIDDPLREENVCLVHFREERGGTRVEIRHYLCDLGVANVVEEAWLQALGQLRTVVSRRRGKKK